MPAKERVERLSVAALARPDETCVYRLSQLLAAGFTRNTAKH